MIGFDAMAEQFTKRVSEAANWKHAYFGAAYSTRIKAAISNLRAAIAEAEQHPEIGTNQTQALQDIGVSLGPYYDNIPE